MSKLKDILSHERGDTRYPDRWTRVTAMTDTNKSPPLEPSGFSTLHEYRTEMKVVVMSKCNPLQWDHDVKDQATRHLFSALFSETEMHLRRAMSAVHGQDEEEIMQCLHDALETLQP